MEFELNANVFVFVIDNHSKLAPNCAAATAETRSQQDSSRSHMAGNVEADIESTASELPCGSTQQTVARGQAAGRKTKVDVKVLKREEKSLQTTIMLITVSSSYVLAYLPVLFHFVVYFIKLKLDRSLDVGVKSMLIAGNYTKMLYVGGVAVNFFLYTVSGRVFRKQLIQMLACRRNTHTVVGGARRRTTGADL